MFKNNTLISSYTQTKLLGSQISRLLDLIVDSVHTFDATYINIFNFIRTSNIYNAI